MRNATSKRSTPRSPEPSPKPPALRSLAGLRQWHDLKAAAAAAATAAEATAPVTRSATAPVTGSATAPAPRPQTPRRVTASQAPSAVRLTSPEQSVPSASRSPSAAPSLSARSAAAPGSADDADADVVAFRLEIGDVTPIRRDRRVVHPAPSLPAGAPRPRRQTAAELDDADALRATMSDEFDVTHWLESDERLSFRQSGVGADVLAGLRAGRWSIAAQLDLHGLRTDPARDALRVFLDRSVRDARRCVRIIHGKGHGSDAGQPVLKVKVWRWIVQRRDVLAACEAPPFQGGAGAVIVLLAGEPRR